MALESLSHFTGSEQIFRHSINRKFVYTEGVQYVASEGGAYWLIDELAITNMFVDICADVLEHEDFQVWRLQKTGPSSAILTTEDGNGKKLLSKEIPFTDFPLDYIEFFVVSAEDVGAGVRMAMLPTEY